ncbi:peptide/nickel transport system permease protein [Halalkaliarchaeum desulfuricum]|uniref:Peptide/nickel transport system permease protein n=1 Tax=Halalkaliarchaeum desulfuricum TaxID=2055893 RepID=A0A343TNC5_9EURY|nr:nickel ABC transporter permease [Halalkaliarchaeum desulfuricum]AUX10597.1 peptide/nickel transport system permease protein [Halalkaliarchaeum desulfuricum]
MRLRRIVLRRIGSATVVMVGVSVITYWLLFLTPGDPAYTILRAQRGGQPSTAEVEAFRAEHGFDDPFLYQYAAWITDVLQGDLGTSYSYSEPVASLLLAYLPNTLELAIAAMAVSLVVALPLGVLSAVHHDTWIDRASQLAALAGVSIPNFWLGYLLILLVSLQLGLTPTSGSGTVAHLVLPAITLGTGLAAVVTRLVRTSMLDVLGEAYVDTARSKGVRERLVIYRHVFRNALLPVVTIVGLQFGFVLSGAVIVEVVFQRPGLGTLLVDAVFARDYPVVQGVVLLIAAVFVAVNQLVDLAYVLLDPRIDRGGRL